MTGDPWRASPTYWLFGPVCSVVFVALVAVVVWGWLVARKVRDEVDRRKGIEMFSNSGAGDGVPEVRPWGPWLPEEVQQRQELARLGRETAADVRAIQREIAEREQTPAATPSPSPR